MTDDIVSLSVLCRQYIKYKDKTGRLKKEVEESLSKWREDLYYGRRSGKDAFQGMCIYEFGEDFEKQYSRIKKLEETLEKHKGQYVQINIINRELDAEYLSSDLGIIGENPLSIRKCDDTRTHLSGLPVYSFELNFEGNHITYVGERPSYFYKERPEFSAPVIKLDNFSKNLTAKRFKEIEFSDSEILNSRYKIYIGNKMFPEMIKSYEIGDAPKFLEINELYEFLKENIPGVREMKRVDFT